MYDKLTQTVMLLIILILITSSSIVKGIFNASVGIGIFSAILIIAFAVYNLSNNKRNKTA